MRPSYSNLAALDAELARRRASDVGLVSVDVPPRPVYTNDAIIEAEREAEYSSFVQRCAAEAAAWNAEARRWHAERAKTIAQRVRADVESIMHSGNASADSSLPGDIEPPLPLPPHFVIGLTGVRELAPATTDVLSGEVGLAATSMLAERADRQADIDIMVAELRALAEWKLAAKERSAAAEAVCAEQERTLVTRWKRRVDEAARQSGEVPPSASMGAGLSILGPSASTPSQTATTLGNLPEVIHITARLASTGMAASTTLQAAPPLAQESAETASVVRSDV